MNKTILTVQDIMERYKISRSTIWRWIKYKGFPPAFTPSNHKLLWRLSDIEAWESSTYGQQLSFSFE